MHAPPRTTRCAGRRKVAARRYVAVRQKQGRSTMAHIRQSAGAVALAHRHTRLGNDVSSQQVAATWRWSADTPQRLLLSLYRNATAPLYASHTKQAKRRQPIPRPPPHDHRACSNATLYRAPEMPNAARPRKTRHRLRHCVVHDDQQAMASRIPVRNASRWKRACAARPGVYVRVSGAGAVLQRGRRRHSEVTSREIFQASTRHPPHRQRHTVAMYSRRYASPGRTDEEKRQARFANTSERYIDAEQNTL